MAIRHTVRVPDTLDESIRERAESDGVFLNVLWNTAMIEYLNPSPPPLPLPSVTFE